MSHLQVKSPDTVISIISGLKPLRLTGDCPQSLSPWVLLAGSVEDLKSIHSSVFTLSRADVYREAGTILYWRSLDPSA